MIDALAGMQIHGNLGSGLELLFLILLCVLPQLLSK